MHNTVNSNYKSLASIMRPEKLSDFIGQNHLVGKNKVIYQIINKKKLLNIIFQGPSGTGKTTLAKILSREFSMPYYQYAATELTTKIIKHLIEIHKDQPFILFLDEIHRYNKAQQDVLLPYIENTQLFLIGATTENPYFSLTNALISRVSIFQMQQFSYEDTLQILNKISKKACRFGYDKVTYTNDFAKIILKISKGDCRFILNIIEQLFLVCDMQSINLNADLLKEMDIFHAYHFDNKGDIFYQQLSAFHKSVRGSDPDAAVWWLTSMLEGGADAMVVARRMICIASEDIGLADPKGLSVAVDALKGYEILGMPEGRLPLIQAAIYLSLAPKSNTSYMAYTKAKKLFNESGDNKVPSHLNTTSRYYKYPHNFKDAYVVQSYLPESIKNAKFYSPTTHGFERNISNKVALLEKIKRG